MTDLYSLENICYAYGDTPALDRIDINLSPGRFYGLIGPNGCGKTTMLDILTGNKAPDSGRIFFNKQPLASCRRRQLARQMALVPQDFTIGFAFTVEEIVMMGRHPFIKRFSAPTPRDRELTSQAMKQIGIHQLRHRYVNELSGGEKQRVVVARALAQDTPVFLFDEATSNLDIHHTITIFNIARQLVKNEGRTIIAVIHNLNLAAAYCDHLIFLQQGRLITAGPTDKSLNPKTISKVFGVESKISLDPYNKSRQVSFRYGEN